ncbi:MAG: secretin and TonB N-terminal domain-containing protein [Gammaproteobacteria bacterium]|nr:secretin and TonB N-terminal domain-containing protein [Gammaproteobacteria bacterium]
MYLRKILLILVFNLFCLVFSVANCGISEKISIDVGGIKTRDLLKMLARHANKSIVVSEKIQGKVTIDLQSVSWREALDSVLQMQGLTKHETDNVIVVVTADELNKNESTLLQRQVFNLRYASSADVAKLLKPAGVLSAHGKLEYDSKSNSLVVADASDNIKEVRRLLKQIDVPAKQVLIEARIVSVDEAFIHELGLEFNGKEKIESGEMPQGQFNFAIAKLGNNRLLDLRLAALENEGRGRVISKPKLLAADRQVAYIEAGAEIPYQEKTKEGNTSVVFKKAVLSLTVTPEVVSKDAIRLSLQLSQDKVGHLVINGVPTIDTRKIHTQVLAHNNGTIVLGGIYEWSKNNYITRVPILGQIPILKIFFSKKESRMERRELLIFVTPQIIK